MGGEGGRGQTDLHPWGTNPYLETCVISTDELYENILSRPSGPTLVLCSLFVADIYGIS